MPQIFIGKQHFIFCYIRVVNLPMYLPTFILGLPLPFQNLKSKP